MSNTTEIGLIALHSEWVGPNNFRVRTRRILKSSVILVDVTEYGRHTSKRRAEKVAREAALLAGTEGSAAVISDYEVVRKPKRLTPEGHVVEAVATKVRSMTFAFGVTA